MYTVNIYSLDFYPTTGDGRKLMESRKFRWLWRAKLECFFVNSMPILMFGVWAEIAPKPFLMAVK